MKGPLKAETRWLSELYDAFLSLESPDECRRFLADLCTPGELTALADRWRVVQLLREGMPYRRIYEKTGVSTATVTRVARSYEHGEGGYLLVLERMTTPVLAEVGE